MKKILIDLYKTEDLYSGLGQFSKNFAQTLVKEMPDDFYFNFLVPPHSDLSFDGSYVGLKKATAIRRYAPFLNQTYDLWHSPYQTSSFFPNTRTPWMMTIHDLNFLVEKEGIKRERYLKRLQRTIDRTDFLTTISDYSKSQIEAHLDLKGKSIAVVHNGVHSGEGIDKIKPSFISERGFFFSIGIFNIKKNFEVLLPMIKYFGNHQLIISGNHDTKYGTAKREIL